MTNGFTSALFSIGIATWVYVKFSQRSNNPRSSIMAAVVTGIIAFIVFFTVLRTFLGK